MAWSLLRHVSHSYRPHTSVLAPDAGGRWLPSPARPGAQSEPGLMVYRFGADLFYANANRFSGEVRSLIEHAPTPVRWFVVDAGAITDIDYSAARDLRDLFEELRGRDLALVFGRVAPDLRADLDRHGALAPIGAGCIFATLHEAIALAARIRPCIPRGGARMSRDHVRRDRPRTTMDGARFR